MTLKTLIPALIVCLAFSNCFNNRGNSNIEPIVNLPAIANKSIEEVNAVLGKPDTIIKTDVITKVNPVGTPNEKVDCEQVFYQNKKIEVIFINKLSDWITINHVTGLPMSEYMITALGLPQTDPRIFDLTAYVTWEEVKGFQNIAFFSKDSSTVDNIYIRVNTK